MAVENHQIDWKGDHFICIEAHLCDCDCDGCYRAKKTVLRWILDKEEYEDNYGEGSWENWNE